MKYRADIDGLRSVAIIPVVLYHAGISMFSGGFVGVDVFFVISGYLITSIILNDIDKDKFTITNFYFRRVKRIFPALYLLFIFTTVFCWFFYIPEDFKAYGKSLLGSVFFISNIVFWREKGYFETASELKPLLHTWSLSVEEQFYIFYPIMLFLLAKYFKKKYIPVVLIIFIFSLSLSVWATPKMPSASFFLLPTRAWELMLGCLLALGFFPKTENLKALNLLSLMGLLMILFSIFLFNHKTPFPGYSALLPCVGTGLIIYSGSFSMSVSSRPLISKFLSWKPFVLIGLVSYSWYLWHWVLFAFRNYYDLVTIDLFVKSNWFLVPFSLLLAAVSYFIVEKPFRDIKWESRRQLFVFSLVLTLIFSLIGVSFSQEGYMGRFTNNQINKYAQITKDVKKRVDYFKQPRSVIIGDKEFAPSFVLMGDSQAWSISDGFNELAKQNNKAGVLFSLNSCSPLIGIKNISDKCNEFNVQTIEQLKSFESIETVFLAAFWTQRVVDNIDIFSGLDNLINELSSRGIKIILITDIYKANFNLPLHLARQEIVHDLFPSYSFLREVRPKTEVVKEKLSAVYKVFEGLKEKYPDIRMIHLSELLCTGAYCEIGDNDLFFADAHHFTPHGAKFVCEELRDEIIPFL